MWTWACLGLHPHTEKVVWNQTEWRIVMDRKDFQHDKMFTGLWAFSTSRLFDVAFLRKHNLLFSDKVLWLEDVWHTGMCLMKADRVCYLPQFIGYHYFINGGSIIQDTKKSMDELHSPEECYLSYYLPKEVLSNPENPSASQMLKDEMNGWSVLMRILRSNATTDYGCHYHFDQVEKLTDYQRLVPMTDYENYKRLLDLQTNIGESGVLTSAPTRHYLINAKGQHLPCTESHLRPYMECFADTLKKRHNLLVAIVGPRKQQTNDGCTVESLESEMVKKYMWYYHFARGKRRADFSMPDDLPFRLFPRTSAVRRGQC